MKNLIFISILFFSCSVFGQTILKNSNFLNGWYIPDENSSQIIKTKFTKFLQANDYQIPDFVEVKAKNLICYENGIIYELIGKINNKNKLYQVLKVDGNYVALQNVNALHQINKTNPPSINTKDKAIEYLTLFVNNTHSAQSGRFKVIPNAEVLNQIIIDKSHLGKFNASQIQIHTFIDDYDKVDLLGYVRLNNQLSYAGFEITENGKVSMESDRVINDRIEFFKEEISGGGFYIDPDPSAKSNSTEWSKYFIFNPTQIPYDISNPWSEKFAGKTKNGGFLVISYINGSPNSIAYGSTVYDKIISSINSYISQASKKLRYKSQHYIVFRESDRGNYENAFNNEFNLTATEKYNSLNDVLMFFQFFEKGELEAVLAITKDFIEEGEPKEQWTNGISIIGGKLIVSMRIAEQEFNVKQIEEGLRVLEEIRELKGN